MMLTRCPACQTTFRLGPEQLHARRGEVRCGHCFHPFNALEHEIVQRSRTPPARPAFAEPPRHLPQDAEPISPAAPPGFIVLEEKPPTSPHLDFEIPEDFSAPTREAAPAEPVPTAEGMSPPTLPEVVRSGRRPATDAPHGDAGSLPPHVKNLAPDGAGTARQFEAGSGPEETSAALDIAAPHPAAGIGSDEAASTDTPAETETGRTAGTQADAAPAKPTDMKAAHIDIEQLDAKYGRPRQPASPLQRALAGLAIGLLGTLLAAQCVYLYRMEIARELPGLRPLLSAACGALGCEIPFPRDAQLIGLDASDLQSEPGKPGQYILYATVNNRAEYAQAWPHMELTLTDARDTPVARRVLAPHEWVPRNQHGATFASRSAINARIPFAAPDLAPTGYRVYIFYP
ncbi:DUF3426 domain-containing protein [Thauera linaloolentis]|uniref:MJ0042 family finger-like protein n=1 Tax=Thauera linaloolentis (strain DSM 12138 / JCM 21573 / CCUG 41526 / CIP 105981 / IAM 15112 / NBRC 102519 / 47Lol) TaxID=1123367 RepID=N6YTN9_THAL4|nr:DUF3426 domain-containing protein [Thauera linaloolentis]ENO85757.1 MJ0042 family finger-like protein [Thauera linaloolentis 47Lol = DSM 12138]MCM8564197.1 zinc-ribbon domain-containing protein [Thauera linaloolentis]